METATVELVRRAAADFDITVVAWRLAPELRALVRWRRIPVPERPFALRFVMFGVLAGARLAVLPRDLTHTLGAIVPNRADVASVHYCHAAVPPDARAGAADWARRTYASTVTRLSLRAERWCYRPSRLRHFAVVSPEVGQEVEEHYPGIPTTLTRNGVDTRRFRPDPATRATVRREQGVGVDDVVVVFVGGDWVRKGLALVIAALGRMTRDGLPVRLWVVGRGDTVRYQEMAATAGVADDVTFFGFRPDRDRLLQSADVFVLPSHYEVSPLAAFEAAATGLPLVITAVNDATTLVHGGRGGMVVEATAAAVGDAIGALAADPARRRTDGDAARERVVGFTWDASAASVTDLYRELVRHEP
jgi:UDP-glucose:(heptosyl)LPS alpha-1,3-glucosyltransferase